MKNQKKIISIFVCIVLFACEKPRPIGGGSATYTYYGKDQNKKAPRSFSDLPVVVQDSTKMYLSNWLGPVIFSKFNYRGGQIIDRELLSVVGRANTTIPDYILHFNILNDTIDYTASLSMSAKGRIIGNVNFPNTAKFKERFTFLSQKAVKEIVVKNSRADTFVNAGSFLYDEDNQIFVWIFDVTSENSNVTHKYTIIKVNAHTGEIMERREGLYYSY